MAPRRAVIAIDHGERRTGFAVADPLRIVTAPLEPFRGTGGEAGLFEHLERLLEERDVDTLLVGLPLNMDGSEGPRSADVRAFADRLAARFPEQRIALYDERLTTKAAEELLRESGRGGPQGRVMRDSYSALVLLRDWIAAGEPG